MPHTTQDFSGGRRFNPIKRGARSGASELDYLLAMTLDLKQLGATGVSQACELNDKPFSTPFEHIGTNISKVLLRRRAGTRDRYERILEMYGY